jgi:hypothetical protein
MRSLVVDSTPTYVLGWVTHTHRHHHHTHADPTHTSIMHTRKARAKKACAAVLAPHLQHARLRIQRRATAAPLISQVVEI